MINEYTAKSYCCEDFRLIENYELAINDTTQTWACHHILGEQYSKKYLKENGLYENRPANEFRFMTKIDHDRLHKKGVPIGPMSEEHKKAISDAKKGVPLSEEHKQAVSEALKGVPKSEEHKKALSEAHKGVQLSEEHKKAIGKGHSKKILQFTKSGEFIREWTSMSEASKQLKICHICGCCNGKLKSAGGYIWKYAEHNRIYLY